MHVLFLYASTGCGHLKAAGYVKEALLKQNSEMTITMADVLNLCYFPVESFILNLFKMLISKCPYVYRLLYRFTENNALFNRFAGLFFSRSIEELQKQCILENVKTIVCTHPLALLFASRLKKKMKADCPVTMGIVTDYQIHKFWLYSHIDLYCVPNEEMKQELLSMGWKKDHVRVTGVPCPANLTQGLDCSQGSVCSQGSDCSQGLNSYQGAIDINHACMAAKQENAQVSDMNDKVTDMADKPFWLVSGGGWGLGDLEATTRSLLKKQMDCNLLVVTGENRSLYLRLKALEEKYPDQLTVMGTIPQLFNTMKNALAVLTKPGGLTVTEAMILKKPLILLKPLPGAEERNLNYLIQHGAAIPYHRFIEDPEIIQHWHEYHSNRQVSTARSDSSQLIAQWILEEKHSI